MKGGFVFGPRFLRCTGCQWLRAAAAFVYLTAASFCPAGTVTVLHSFNVLPNGSHPDASLVEGLDGNYYGTTANGGALGSGLIYQLTPNGALTPIYAFTNGLDGSSPVSALTPAGDGSFYGVAEAGGAASHGTVFHVTTNGVLTPLYAFTNGVDGSLPQGTLVLGGDGNLYGTTVQGGTNSHGTVFNVATNTGLLTPLYLFTNGFDGSAPVAGLALGNDGNYYGVASGGGSNTQGTVFQVTPGGGFTLLYTFSGGTNGAEPEGALALGSDGSFYGVTRSGGADSVGLVFHITTNGALTNLYTFTNAFDGGIPFAGLVLGNDGNLYGTTAAGGSNSLGGVFEITTNGVLTPLHAFAYADGSQPQAGLVQGSDGMFYGAASSGGNSGNGSLFKLTPGSFTLLYLFPAATDGTYPQGGLVQASDGYLYGTTFQGGANYGTIFKMTTNGAFTPLHSFDYLDGVEPQAGLTLGNDGYLYGTTVAGGSNFNGVIFKISTNGYFTNLHDFTASADGSGPQSGLVQASDGYLYGTTANGGTNAAGVFFKMTTNGVVIPLYSFTNGLDGANPEAGVIQGVDASFYGTTVSGGSQGHGGIYKITSNGVCTALYQFTNGVDGATSKATLVQGYDGWLYGTAYFGGASNYGSVFKITTNGAFTPLYSFTNGVDGANPQAGLTLGSDGSFYGTTQNGGANHYGALFKITTNGLFRPLYSFGNALTGIYPYAPLVQATDGSFYGTAFQGGGANDGTIFQLTVPPATAPVFISASQSGELVGLTWTTLAGQLYQLQYKTNLTQPSWVNLGNAFTGTNGIALRTDTADPNPQRFYRVLSW